MPGTTAAVTLGLSDVLAKVVLIAGCDVLTMLSVRSVIGIGIMAIWLRFGERPQVPVAARWIAASTGVVFAALVFCLFEAIKTIDVPTAILSYFIYPLFTGLAASALGLERLRWQGALCGLVAFVGLAVMIGAHPAGLAAAGVAYALAAACCRTAILLITRARLVGVDPQLTTWYSLVSSTAIFLLLSVATWNWTPPLTSDGWFALVGLSFAITVGIMFIFISTVRVGAFRTALIMQLEPLTAMLLSAPLLGEVITPLQGLGSAVMLAALVAFQLWR